VYYYANEDAYEGEWKKNKRDGEGVLNKVSGEKFEGEWSNDEMIKGHFSLYCIGVCYYENGDKYEGDWRKSKRDGTGNIVLISIGVLHKNNGDKYEGKWRNDEMSGKGSLYSKHRQIRIQQW